MPRMVGRSTLVRLAAMLGLAGVWVLIEWSRTWLFGGFPWMPLAATQWEKMRSVLQVAAYTGAYGASFVLVAVNIGFTRTGCCARARRGCAAGARSSCWRCSCSSCAWRSTSPRA
jgi:apolipoprotein N-acyltransferase